MICQIFYLAALKSLEETQNAFSFSKISKHQVTKVVQIIARDGQEYV